MRWKVVHFLCQVEINGVCPNWLTLNEVHLEDKRAKEVVFSEGTMLSTLVFFPMKDVVVKQIECEEGEVERGTGGSDL